jgi:hypothetical protein
MFIGFILGVLFSIVVAIGGGYVTIISGWVPASAGATPGWFE